MSKKEEFTVEYTKTYDCRMIVKFKKINDTIIETYLVSKDGIISIEIIENGKLTDTYQLGNLKDKSILGNVNIMIDEK